MTYVAARRLEWNVAVVLYLDLNLKVVCYSAHGTRRFSVWNRVISS